MILTINDTILKLIKPITKVACALIVCSQFIVPAAQSQDNVNAVSAALSQYHQNSIKEKIFVHTDKNFYVTGEVAWFKLYLVNASTHKPLELSKVAYVEILDSANKHLLQAKIALNAAEGNGSFYLPLSLTSGNYKLRAYTNWMKNFGADYFFEKNITIINVQRRANLPAIKPSDKFDVGFFPEGGNLVNNIPGRVAFKGTDQYGKGISFIGSLLDNTDTILTFKPEHAGMGSFTFTPVSNHTYKAFIQTPSGESVIKELPAAYARGYVMSVTDTVGKIRVVVQSDYLLPTDVYLFAHTREIIKVAAAGTLKDGKAVFLFDKALLGDGISHITIFNQQKQPVCERLYFKRPAMHLDLILTADQPSYATRKKISINIRSGSTPVKSDSASLSMTVYRLDSLQPVTAPTIDSYLLLTSDLRGYVEDPNYYFLKDDPETNSAIDNLMLTNGWRRFKWEEVLKNTKPHYEYIPEYNGPVISANVVNTKDGNPGADIESYMAIPGLQAAFSPSVSDKGGHVRFESKYFYASSEIILQPNTVRDSIYRIDITDPFSNDFSANPSPSFSLNQNTAETLLQQSISMQVQNIYSGKNLKKFMTPVMDTTGFYITPDAKYLLDNYTRFTTIEEILREYVAQADVKKREGNFHFELYDFGNNENLKNDPFVMLDGVPVFDFNKFMQVDPLKLYKVEVVNRRYFLGHFLFNGVLNWTSYKGDMADYDPGPHATVIDYDGLQPEREFYSPPYVTEEQQASHIPDFRNVLLWSPHIKIPGGASKDIGFFTSDLPGQYLVLIEGISSSGLPGFATTTFTVAGATK